MSSLTIVLALYGSSLEQRRTVSILRAIGAGKNSIVTIVLMESLLVVIMGCIGGFLAGYALSAALSAYIGGQSSITLTFEFEWKQLFIFGIVAGIGVAAGIVLQ